MGIEALSGIRGPTGGTPLRTSAPTARRSAETVASVRTWDRQVSRRAHAELADCEFGYRSSPVEGGPVPGSAAVRRARGDLPAAAGHQSAPVRYAELARACSGSSLRSAHRWPRSARQCWRCAHQGHGAGRRRPRHLERRVVLHEPRCVDACPAHACPTPRPAGRPPTAGWQDQRRLADRERAASRKGYGLPGPAGLSTKHTLAITNRGSATTADVLALARHLRGGVLACFGIELSLEPTPDRLLALGAAGEPRSSEPPILGPKPRSPG